jgi:hypothetical protein
LIATSSRAVWMIASSPSNLKDRSFVACEFVAARAGVHLHIVCGAHVHARAFQSAGQAGGTVAWGNSPSSGAAQVVFSTWSGTVWVETTCPAIDLTAAQGIAADLIAVALDSMGRPIVAFRGDAYRLPNPTIARDSLMRPSCARGTQKPRTPSRKSAVLS